MTNETNDTGRSQLVQAAMRAVAQHGSKGATVRLIAAEAGVTNGLIVHHFGTKEALFAEVDAMVLARLRDAMSAAEDVTTPADATQTISRQLSAVIGADAHLRAYLRRSILEATPAGATVIRQLVDIGAALLVRFGARYSGTDLQWLSTQILAVNLAGVVFEPFLEEALGEDPFAPSSVAQRTAANRRFIENALAVQMSPQRRKPVNGSPKPVKPHRRTR